MTREIIFALAEKGSDIGKVAQNVLNELKLKGAKVKEFMNSATVSVGNEDIFSVCQIQDTIHITAPLDQVGKYGLDNAAESAGYKRNYKLNQ
jgi:hypothetical protein